MSRWDEFCMAHSANENGICWQYAVARRVVQRSSTLLALESPWMSMMGWYRQTAKWTLPSTSRPEINRF